ncbi:hypothetical protein CSKR_109110 [Clonorchis sinensis]|uniref:Uncharacterized protein n=1 Tax=Clonorchis sinensis TaxID=79923 RepID=A0A3R7CC51_CLOSI|nr:hypothetical protein CSKR_109110 [Clonorchis sinensis]
MSTRKNFNDTIYRELTLIDELPSERIFLLFIWMRSWKKVIVKFSQNEIQLPKCFKGIIRVKTLKIAKTQSVLPDSENTAPFSNFIAVNEFHRELDHVANRCSPMRSPLVEILFLCLDYPGSTFMDFYRLNASLAFNCFQVVVQPKLGLIWMSFEVEGRNLWSIAINECRCKQYTEPEQLKSTGYLERWHCRGRNAVYDITLNDWKNKRETDGCQVVASTRALDTKIQVFECQPWCEENHYELDSKKLLVDNILNKTVYAIGKHRCLYLLLSEFRASILVGAEPLSCRCTSCVFEMLFPLFKSFSNKHPKMGLGYGCARKREELRGVICLVAAKRANNVKEVVNLVQRGRAGLRKREAKAPVAKFWKGQIWRHFVVMVLPLVSEPTVTLWRIPDVPRAVPATSRITSLNIPQYENPGSIEVFAKTVNELELIMTTIVSAAQLTLVFEESSVLVLWG